MGRAPCCDKANVKRGPWSPDEDNTLRNYLEKHGTGGNWIALPRKAGLKRCGKSCRLRWLNYLRPDIKHGGFTDEEDNIIYSLYNSIGSRWSIIAAQLPGRTDNDIKNHWNTKLKKKILAPKNNEIITITDSSTGSVPVEVEALGNGITTTTTSSSYMTDMYQQNYGFPGLVLDRHDQFPLSGAMDHCTTSTANNNYSTMPSSQEFSTFFPLENHSTAWFMDGGTEDQGILLDQLDFEAPHNPDYLFTASSQM